MNRRDKNIDKIFGGTTPTDIKYSEFKRALTSIGFIESTKGSSSGSRVKFSGPNKEIIQLHMPHGKNPVNRLDIKNAKSVLQQNRYI